MNARASACCWILSRAVVLGVMACGRAAPSIELEQSQVLPASVELPDSKVAPTNKPRPAFDFDLAHRFSPELYADFAARLIPYEQLAREAAAAVRPAQLQARELDLFEDDWLTRDGALVLLGVEHGRVVALTTRFYADITYPDPRLIADGWGAAEIGGQYLQIGGPGEICSPAKKCKGPRFRLQRYGSKPAEQRVLEDLPTLEYRMFDDHDMALLYFPKRGAPFKASETLGVAEPSRLIERKLREASNVYGFEMRLVSTASMTELRSHIAVESTAEKLIQGAMAIAVGPLAGAIAGGLPGVPEKLIQKATERATGLAAKKLARYAERLGDDWETGDRDVEGATVTEGVQLLGPGTAPKLMDDATVEVSTGGVSLRDGKGRSHEVKLLGVRLHDDAHAAAAAWISAAIGKGQVILSSENWGSKRAGSLVLIPGDRLVLNVELLAHGFARLDVEDESVLSSFPLLVEAAWGALERRTGLALAWHDDEAYVAAVSAAR